MTIEINKLDFWNYLHGGFLCRVHSGMIRVDGLEPSKEFLPTFKMTGFS